MWRLAYEGLERGIERAREKFGDGPYLIVVHARSLDIDGIMDTFELRSSHADLDEARVTLERTFQREVSELVVDDTWHNEPPSVAVAFDPVHGVRLVTERGIKRKDSTGFNAETRIVQLLEIATPPVIGEPLFRALGYPDELAFHLTRYR
jgi:hypothetical protein